MLKSILKSSRCSLCGGAEGHCSMLAPMGGHAKDADESYPIATGFIAMPATQRLGFCSACYLEVPSREVLIRKEIQSPSGMKATPLRT